MASLKETRIALLREDLRATARKRSQTRDESPLARKLEERIAAIKEDLDYEHNNHHDH